MLADTSIQQSVEEFSVEYTSALKAYLTSGEEAALQRAYELGRAAVLAGLGILDMAELHRQAIKTALQ